MGLSQAQIEVQKKRDQKHINGMTLDEFRDERIYKAGVWRFGTLRDQLLLAEKEPPLLKLVGSLWSMLETCILFAGINDGKTLLSMQIANALAKGENVCDRLPNEAGRPLKVMVCDLELTPRQLLNRMPPLQASVNLWRAELNPDEMEVNSDKILNSMDTLIAKAQPEVLIIDNITWLLSSTEKHEAALDLMKGVKRISRKYSLTTLIIAHTPKRHTSQPIELKHIFGSSHFGQFVDSAFAIGSSVHGDSHKYVKQVKCRMDEKEFGEDNVLDCKIIKDENQVARFDFLGTITEQHHIGDLDKLGRNDKIKELYLQGKTQSEISKLLKDEGFTRGISQSTISNVINELKLE